MKIENQVIPIDDSGLVLEMKREDLIHPFVSGNKYRKLKYNLLAAKEEGHDTILTFGGAYSNHIAAVAAACHAEGFRSIGIIRGEELVSVFQENPTLSFAANCGMQLEFVDRELYRNKSIPEFLERLGMQWGNFYLLPEGGTNELAVKGCAEILTEEDSRFDFVCCSVGTGGTLAGLINSSFSHQKIIGFAALNGGFLKEEICKFAANDRWEIIGDFAFGGYAKITRELVDFINRFFAQTGIRLDPVYTGKMVYGVMKLIEGNYFPENARILMIHTGGLQGVAGMNLRLRKLKLPLLFNETK